MLPPFLTVFESSPNSSDLQQDEEVLDDNVNIGERTEQDSGDLNYENTFRNERVA